MKLFLRDDQKAAAQAQQSRIDAIVTATRARAEAQVPEKRSLFRAVSHTPQAPLPPTDDILEQRLSEELACVRRALDSIGERLCSDPVLLTRYQVLLQGFDLLGQTIGHLSAIVGAADKNEAVERVGMVELRARLQRHKEGVAATGPTFVRPDSNPFNHH